MKVQRNLSHSRLAPLARLSRCLQHSQLRLTIGFERRSQGQGLVEFALILPLLLLLLTLMLLRSYQEK